ncbi:MAG: hypothetical protein ABI384_08400 [Allobranchiibius sp.]|jgi:hypothetical protein
MRAAPQNLLANGRWPYSFSGTAGESWSVSGELQDASSAGRTSSQGLGKVD